MLMLSLDYTGFRVSIRPSWMVCFCRSRHHDHLHSAEYDDRTNTKEDAGTANEEPRSANEINERAFGQY
jgi:hypothetical protein